MPVSVGYHLFEEKYSLSFLFEVIAYCMEIPLNADLRGCYPIQPKTPFSTCSYKKLKICPFSQYCKAHPLSTLLK